MLAALMRMQQEAEAHCLAALANNDRDSADAWEAIGLDLGTLLEQTRRHWTVIRSRRGLMQPDLTGMDA